MYGSKFTHIRVFLSRSLVIFIRFVFVTLCRLINMTNHVLFMCFLISCQCSQHSSCMQKVQNTQKIESNQAEQKIIAQKNFNCSTSTQISFTGHTNHMHLIQIQLIQIFKLIAKLKWQINRLKRTSLFVLYKRVCTSMQDREERAVKHTTVVSPPHTHVSSTISPQASIQEEAEPEVIGAGLPLLHRLKMLKAKQEKQKDSKDSQSRVSFDPSAPHSQITKFFLKIS